MPQSLVYVNMRCVLTSRKNDPSSAAHDRAAERSAILKTIKENAHSPSDEIYSAGSERGTAR